MAMLTAPSAAQNSEAAAILTARTVTFPGFDRCVCKPAWKLSWPGSQPSAQVSLDPPVISDALRGRTDAL